MEAFHAILCYYPCMATWWFIKNCKLCKTAEDGSNWAETFGYKYVRCEIYVENRTAY